MSTNSNDYSYLKELGKNYKVADGEPDIRNWVVKNEKGNILGEVDELIFDTKSRKAVFIVLNLDKNELNLKERKVLLPVGYADINVAYKNVLYKGLQANEISALPDYEKGKFARNSLDLISSTFLSINGNDSLKDESQAKYASEGFSEHSRSRKRVAAGPSRVHSDPSPEDGLHSYTVIGVFESAKKARTVINDLIDRGYDRKDITVSTRQTDLEFDHHNHNAKTISNFFRSLFTNHDDVNRYEDATDNNYVVSVDVSSSELAEEAANILDEHGSIKMTVDLPEDEHALHTRVFKRHE